jgi:hypothetical protein
MKLKALITTVFFIGALFTGSALAADTGTTGGTTDQQAGQGREADQDRQTGVFGQDGQDEIAGMHKADDLMGKNVVSQDGEEIGSIDNLVISEDGQVEYIILSRGGMLGVGGDMVPVPCEAANLQKDQDDQLKADLTKQQLEGAPTFNGDNWAQIASPDYEQEVHSYFGTEQRSGSDALQQSPGMQDSPSSPGMQDSPDMKQQSPRNN